MLRHEHGAGAAEGQEHRADVLVAESLGGLGCGFDVAFELVGVAADDLGELLGVRLHQVDPLAGLQQRGERDAGGVDRDPDVVAVALPDGRTRTASASSGSPGGS